MESFTGGKLLVQKIRVLPIFSLTQFNREIIFKVVHASNPCRVNNEKKTNKILIPSGITP